MTPSVDTVPICPECGRADIQRRTWRYDVEQRHGDRREGWLCKACDAAFNDPDHRERDDARGLHGLAKTLDELDPDSVGGESA